MGCAWGLTRICVLCGVHISNMYIVPGFTDLYDLSPVLTQIFRYLIFDALSFACNVQAQAFFPP